MHDGQTLTITLGDDVVFTLTTINDIPFYTEVSLRALAQKENLDILSYIKKNLTDLITAGTITLYDITSCTFTFSVSRSYRGEILFNKTSTDGDIVITDAANGLAEITVSTDDTAEFLNVDSEYVYDLKITKPTGKKETICRGKLRVLAGVNGE